MSSMTRATRKGHGFTDTTRIVFGGTGPIPGVGPLAGCIGTMKLVPYSGIRFIPEAGEYAGKEMWIGGVAAKFWAEGAE